MKKLGIYVIVVISAVAIIFSCYVLGNSWLIKRNNAIAQTVLGNIVTSIFNEVQAKGFITLSVKDKEGKTQSITLVKQPEIMPVQIPVVSK